ncbi:hypothetical protein ACOSQ4_033223 [Xanthoceras sorbifolium]
MRASVPDRTKFRGDRFSKPKEKETDDSSGNPVEVREVVVEMKKGFGEAIEVMVEMNKGFDEMKKENDQVVNENKEGGHMVVQHSTKAKVPSFNSMEEKAPVSESDSALKSLTSDVWGNSIATISSGDQSSIHLKCSEDRDEVTSPKIKRYKHLAIGYKALGIEEDSKTVLGKKELVFDEKSLQPTA